MFYFNDKPLYARYARNMPGTAWYRLLSMLKLIRVQVGKQFVSSLFTSCWPAVHVFCLSPLKPSLVCSISCERAPAVELSCASRVFLRLLRFSSHTLRKEWSYLGKKFKNSQTKIYKTIIHKIWQHTVGPLRTYNKLRTLLCFEGFSPVALVFLPL